VNSPKQKPLTSNTQQPQQTHIHTPCGNQSRRPSNRAVGNSQLRPRDHWER